MQAYAVQGRLIGLSGLCVFSKFHIETITERRMILQITQLEHL
jgi:hypothetical protein